MAPENTSFNAPLEDSLEPSLFSNPLLSAIWHDFNLLLQIGHIIHAG